jgi:peptide/nickel transport system substrate-binding protein
MRNKILFVASLLIIASMVLAACATPTAEVKEVVKTVIVEKEGETVIETVEVEKIVEVEKTAEPEAAMEFKSADPKTFTLVTFGDTDTLDPAWNYESAGDAIIDNLYDQLVVYEGSDASKVVPELASSWEVLDGGLTYVFQIREGVKFHEGQDLTPEDVAYSFQRGLLQGGGWSPQWLYTEAFFGADVYDVAELVDPSGALDDDVEGLQAADPALLLAACETVTSKIVADDAAGTVTFYLAQSWAPLMATLAGSWGSIIDKDWSIENGTWDGDCATWQNFYGITSGSGPIQTIANGTGPFKLDHWTPGEETVLVANENYWVSEPLYEGGPSGPPAFDRVVRLSVDEWGTRFAMMQAGDADWASVPVENRPQVDPLVGEWCEFADWGVYECEPTENPNGPLRLWKGTPGTSRTDALFVFDIAVEGGNPYVGSGELDGNGIPADFFSDVHVRKAFNYCFDWDVFIHDVFAGEAVQNYGPINWGMLGYNPDGPHYSYDLEMCQAEIEQAWGGAVAENGFRFQIGYNTGNTTRQIVAQILQTNFSDIDDKYQIEIIGLPWPSFLAAYRGQRLPIAVSGWGQDIADPHNWAQPFMVGTYAARQGLPEDMLAEYGALVSAGVAGTTDQERIDAYYALGQADYDNATAIRLVVGTGRSYIQRWVNHFINPAWYEPYYFISKE